MMQRWGFRKSDRCPRCNKRNETAIHVVTCQQEEAKILWEEEINRFQEWLQRQQTDPSIVTAIIMNIRKWRKSEGIFGHHYHDKLIRRAIKQQNNIGWDQMWLGRISECWGEAQGRFYKRINSRKTGNTWAQELIKELWRIHWAIWNQRNEILHATGNHKVLGTKALEKSIKQELKIGTSLLLPTEKYLFQGINMGTVRKWSANKKEKWLKTVQAARNTSSVRHQKTKQSRQNMLNWLKT